MKKLALILILFSFLPLMKVNAIDYNDFTFTMQEELFFQLLMIEPSVNEQAEEPFIDPVWKKTPGYNGRKLNVEKSLQKMLEEKEFQENKLIYDTIEPTKTLQDLPSAAIYRGNLKKDKVAFIMNVAWGNEVIPEVLSILKENNIHITFSLEGKWAKNNPDLVKLIVDAGHELANHSFSHPDMATLGLEKQIEQISATNEIIRAYTNEMPKWFGPPSGSYNETTLQAVKQLNMELVMWSIDTIDWKNSPEEKIMHRVRSKLHKGAIILMHPKENTKNTLPEMIQMIKENQLKITTLSELLSTNR